MEVFEPRTGGVKYVAPDPESLGFSWDELKAEVEKMNQLAEDYHRTVRRARELHDGRREAERKDQQAFAASIQGGGKDPGTPHADQLADDLRQAERRRDALKVALESQALEISRVTNTHRTEWRGEVADRVPEVQQRLEAAVQEVERVRKELAELRGLEQWLEGPEKPYSPLTTDKAGNSRMVMRGGVNRRGEEKTLAEVLAEARPA